METQLQTIKNIPNSFKYNTDFLDAVLKTALTLNFPIAIWRLPVQTESGNRHIVIDFSGKTTMLTPDLEKLPAGFIVSPFVQENENVHFIKADFHYQSQENYNTIQNIICDDKLSKANSKKFIALLNKNILSKEIHSKIEITKTNKENKNTKLESEINPQENFEKIVSQAILAMQQGQFQKVVLSRTKTVDLQTGFDLAKAFEKLCHLYPHAFISLVSCDEFGTWLGASPEILISLDNNKIFRTVALAGTQAKGEITNLQEAMWRQKEIEEQALVSRYIINCLKKIRVREFDEDGPKTVVAGNLMHLKTDFTIDTIEINFPELATVMLNLLHPTSAVCGMPKKEALDFILANENYDRKLYAGYLGQVNINEETHLFVNLRCMQVLDNQAVLYAGGGITKDSVPAREWIETELKCKTIAQVLKND